MVMVGRAIEENPIELGQGFIDIFFVLSQISDKSLTIGHQAHSTFAVILQAVKPLETGRSLACREIRVRGQTPATIGGARGTGLKSNRPERPEVGFPYRPDSIE